MIASVFLALAAIVVLGSLFVYLFPDIPIDSLRKYLNRIVLTVFLPALNFKVIYEANIGAEFWQIPVVSIVGLAASLLVGASLYAFFSLHGRSKGALILACAFSNVTYFGIAVLQGLFPDHLLEVLKVAILFEITITPLNLLIGSALASYYGDANFSLKRQLTEVFRLPLLWSTFVALIFNIFHIEMPSFVVRGTTLLASAVSGLMILSLGMALKYPILKLSLRRFHVFLPVLFVKLLFSPLIVYLGACFLGIKPPYFQASIIEAAMPSQLISLAIVDRYNLDVELLAIAISVDTVVSFFTIPLIHSWLVA